jgi:transglutaminase-like putative cysteine protease
VVRATLPLGFTIERTAFEIAYENFRRRDTLRLMRATAAPGPGAVVPVTVLAAGLRPAAPRDTMTLRVRLGGGDLGGLDVDGGRQRLTGDTLTVSREADVQLRSRYRLPDSDTTRRDDLRPDLLIASTDRRIVRLAGMVTGTERDPGRVAATLVHWVAGTVRPERSDAIPMATEVLARRRGDCNEHVVLFVALARAMGLPARPVAGLLLLNGRYYYHAWAEVLLGDWVAVDPTFDQFPADVAHVRLVIGGFARPTDLTPRVGRLTLDTL